MTAVTSAETTSAPVASPSTPLRSVARPPAKPATKLQPLAARLAAPRSVASADVGAGLDALASATPFDRHDRFITLLAIYDLTTAPLRSLGVTARHAGHPAVAALKAGLETVWLAELETAPLPAGLSESARSDNAAEGMRRLAARDRLPQAYRWLARESSWEELVRFLAIEGGPDGGFDDLVAACQIGLSGSAKLELAQNYWDEMGNGRLEAVHTTMHEAMARAINMPRIPRAEQPVEALERVALGGLFATNHWLQPEMVGALGLLELQAGPRCRLVLQAFDRLGAPSGAYPFYAEHAEVDPRHGKDWLDKAVVPLCEQQPEWAPRIVRGAWWRSHTNRALFDLLLQQFTARPQAQAA